MTQRFVSWPAHHPAAALVISAVAIALCALAVGRMRPSASLESMLSKDDPAVKAVVRVLNEFPAAEDMLVLATAPANQTGRPDPDQRRIHDLRRDIQPDRAVDGGRRGLQQAGWMRGSDIRPSLADQSTAGARRDSDHAADEPEHDSGDPL